MLSGTNPIFQSHSLRTLSLTYKPPQALLMRYIRHHVSKLEQMKITQCKSPHYPSLLQYKQACRSHTLYHKHIEFYSCVLELRTSLLITGFLKLLPFLGSSINYSILESEPKGRHQLCWVCYRVSHWVSFVNQLHLLTTLCVSVCGPQCGVHGFYHKY